MAVPPVLGCEATAVIFLETRIRDAVRRFPALRIFGHWLRRHRVSRVEGYWVCHSCQKAWLS